MLFPEKGYSQKITNSTENTQMKQIGWYRRVNITNPFQAICAKTSTYVYPKRMINGAKVFKSGLSKFCERRPLKKFEGIWSA